MPSEHQLGRKNPPINSQWIVILFKVWGGACLQNVNSPFPCSEVRRSVAIIVWDGAIRPHPKQPLDHYEFTFRGGQVQGSGSLALDQGEIETFGGNVVLLAAQGKDSTLAPGLA